MMKVLLLTSALLLAAPVGAQGGPKIKKPAEFFKNKTQIENPLELRDPFKAPLFKIEGAKQGRGFVITGKGTYSNIAANDLRSLSLQTMKVVGVLIGKERRALIQGAGKEVIILKEGMKIGPDQAELKAILPGGIVLVEKIVNVYGQEEYLETVIPISR